MDTMADAFVEPLKTPPARAAWVWIFRPKVDKEEPEKKPKHTITLLFPSDADLSELKKAAKEAARQKWGSDAEAKVKHKSFKSPFKSQDAIAEDKDGNKRPGMMPGGTFIEAWSYTKPGVAGPKRDPVTGKVEILTSDEEFYSGCWVVAKVRPYAWANKKGGFGISFELINVQKIKDDQRLGGGGRSKPEDDFEPIAPLDESDPFGESADAEAATAGGSDDDPPW